MVHHLKYDLYYHLNGHTKFISQNWSIKIACIQPIRYQIPGPEVKKLFHAQQVSMKFQLLIKTKMMKNSYFFALTLSGALGILTLRLEYIIHMCCLFFIHHQT